MCYDNDDIITGEKQENSLNFQRNSNDLYTRITDDESSYYRGLGLKNHHIFLLKRLVMFSKKEPLFSVSNSFLKNYCGVESRTTIYNYLAKLQEVGLINIRIQHQKYGKSVFKARLISVNRSKLYLCSNFEHIKTKNIVSKSQEEKPKSNLEKIPKLFAIFTTKLKELGYKINPLDIQTEVQKFHNYYCKKGFDRWIKNGKRLTYRAVEK